MKCKVVTGFFDKEDRERFKKAGTELDVTDARFKELEKKKLVKGIDNKSTAETGVTDEKPAKK